MVIFGIDPGIATLGYGVISCSLRKGRLDGEFKALDFGIVSTKPGQKSEQRLKQIYVTLRKLFKLWQPDLVALENVYFFKNAKTLIPTAQAKGVAMLAAAQDNLMIKEVTPLQVKMAITGFGHAQKKQVQQMIKLLLKLKTLPRPDDAADGLGVAVCAAYLLASEQRGTTKD